ncbi:MAG: hypothetical protein FWE65_03310, partial [Eggerthellaceae bacterium]|nr:hypothetical protein [Eggerthellaceae bacterium]
MAKDPKTPTRRTTRQGNEAAPKRQASAAPVRKLSPKVKGDYSSRRQGGTGPKKPEQPKTGLRLPQLIFLLLLLALVVAAGFFVWNRWFRFDDTQDFQGKWLIAETSNSVAIDHKSIEITADISYSYELDTRKKTVSYSFGSLQGSGIYRFSADRSKLVIIEGGSTDFWLDLKTMLNLALPEEGADSDATTVLIRVTNVISLGDASSA